MHHLIFLNTHFMSWRKQSDRDTKEQICAILGGCGSTFVLAPFCANGARGQLPAWDWVSWCYWSLWRVASWRTWSAQGLQHMGARFWTNRNMRTLMVQLLWLKADIFPANTFLVPQSDMVNKALGPPCLWSTFPMTLDTVCTRNPLRCSCCYLAATGAILCAQASKPWVETIWTLVDSRKLKGPI